MHTPSTDAFWSVVGDNLFKTTFTYSNGLPNGVASATTYTLSVSMGPSDIAIDVSASYCTRECISNKDYRMHSFIHKFHHHISTSVWNESGVQVPNKTLYGCTGNFFSVDLSNLALDPLPVTTIGGSASAQCAFNADFTVLYGESGDDMVTINLATGIKTPTGWTPGNYIDLGGSSFFGTAGPGPSGSCHASVKTGMPKTAKRGGLLRYRAHVKNGNKTITSLNNVRVEVTLPPEVTVVSSTTSLKHRGVVGSASDGVLAWGVFNLTRHKKARFGFKARVSTTATKGQVLTLNTTVYEDGAACPQQTNMVRLLATRVLNSHSIVVVWTGDAAG